MAGGKETPRQKMIGMMYLVLTALLALNVSKQIVAAFITLNNKIDTSAEIIDIKAKDAYGVIENKRVSLIAQGSDTKEVDFWNGKAMDLKKEAAAMVGFILNECNDMIKDSEGEDWVQEKDEDGNIIKLKPLEEISGMDNYDIPTNMFVGGNPSKPNERGQQLVNRIHEFRNYLTTNMGTYDFGGEQYTFVAPENESELSAALQTARVEDTSAIAQMYRALTIPEKLYAHGEDEMMPWVSVTFDHAPIVAAAAMFTSLKLDIKNAEAQAAAYYAAKIDADIFKINKIEPMAIAPSAYINIGDSLPVNVRIAAYDTTDEAIIKYGIDEDTIPERWVETSGPLSFAGQSPGTHKAKGVISVQERGQTKWKPWEYEFTVGQPMGVVAQPNMRVFYWGYKNEIEATGSGFPSENISVNPSGCRIVREGGKMYAMVDRGTRNASISVNGKKDDGSSVSLGSFQFKCYPLPKPEISISGVKDGDVVPYVQGRNVRKVRVGYSPDVPITDAKFTVVSGEIKVLELPGNPGSIGSNGQVSSTYHSKLNQCSGKTVFVSVKYRDPAGIQRIGSMSFKVR